MEDLSSMCEMVEGVQQGPVLVGTFFQTQMLL